MRKNARSEYKEVQDDSTLNSLIELFFMGEFINEILHSKNMVGQSQYWMEIITDTGFNTIVAYDDNKKIKKSVAYTNL